MATIDQPERPSRFHGASERARFAVVTSTGARSFNEDSWAVNSACGVFAVIDGMGGQGSSGRPAAEILAASFESLELSRSAEIEPVTAAALRAGDRIRAFVENNRAYLGTMSEFAAIRLTADSVVIAHAGAARVYRLLPEGIEQLTQDHTLQAMLLREGKAEQAANYRSVTVRFIGMVDGADNEQVEVAVQPRISGTRFLLATNGLWEFLCEKEIEAALRSSPTSATDCCERLVSAASASGDNVTAMVVDLL